MKKEVYKSTSKRDIDVILSALERNDIHTETKESDKVISILIYDIFYDKAIEVIERELTPPSETFKKWICTSCNVEVDENLAVCWQCESKDFLEEFESKKNESEVTTKNTNKESHRLKTSFANGRIKTISHEQKINLFASQSEIHGFHTKTSLPFTWQFLNRFSAHHPPAFAPIRYCLVKFLICSCILTIAYINLGAHRLGLITFLSAICIWDLLHTYKKQNEINGILKLPLWQNFPTSDYVQSNDGVDYEEYERMMDTFRRNNPHVIIPNSYYQNITFLELNSSKHFGLGIVTSIILISIAYSFFDIAKVKQISVTSGFALICFLTALLLEYSAKAIFCGWFILLFSIFLLFT